jgi:Na+/H+-dicarboxylate symporter
MGILSFCIVFGRIIGVLGDRGRDLHNFFETLSKSFLEMIQIIIWLIKLYYVFIYLLYQDR